MATSVRPNASEIPTAYTAPCIGPPDSTAVPSPANTRTNVPNNSAAYFIDFSPWKDFLAKEWDILQRYFNCKKLQQQEPLRQIPSANKVNPFGATGKTKPTAKHAATDYADEHSAAKPQPNNI